jgi:phosphate uptake regulator
MTHKFHDELNELKTDITKMGQLAKEMLQKAVDSLKNDDLNLACWVQ